MLTVQLEDDKGVECGRWFRCVQVRWGAGVVVSGRPFRSVVKSFFVHFNEGLRDPAQLVRKSSIQRLPVLLD